MTFDKDEFMQDVVTNSMWPNNLTLDWDRIHGLALAIHESIENGINAEQTLLEGLILMEWLSGVATVNYRALRNQMMGRMIDGDMTTDEIFGIVMSPKQSIDIDVIGDIDDNMKDLMAGIGQALNEALSSSKEDSSKGMMNDILQQLKNSKRADKIDEDSFINMLNALKKAANDDLQEEE
jgi:hypothetical protein